MPQVFSLLKRSIALIKEDWSIIILPAICYLALYLIGAYFFPAAENVESENYLPQITSVLILVHSIKVFITLAVSAMIKGILDEASINFLESIWIAIKKYFVVVLLDILFFSPMVLIMIFIPQIEILKAFVGFFVLLLSVVSVFFPVISVNDNLGPINVIRKVILFARINKRTLFSFVMAFLLLMLISMFLAVGVFFVPVIGESLLLPIYQGFSITIGVSIVYLYYVENNGFIC